MLSGDSHPHVAVLLGDRRPLLNTYIYDSGLWRRSDLYSALRTWGLRGEVAANLSEYLDWGMMR